MPVLPTKSCKGIIKFRVRSANCRELGRSSKIDLNLWECALRLSVYHFLFKFNGNYGCISASFDDIIKDRKTCKVKFIMKSRSKVNIKVTVRLLVNDFLFKFYGRISANFGSVFSFYVNY